VLAVLAVLAVLPRAGWDLWTVAMGIPAVAEMSRPALGEPPGAHQDP